MNSASPSFRPTGTNRSSPGILNTRSGDHRYYQAQTLGGPATEAMARGSLFTIPNATSQTETAMVYSSSEGVTTPSSQGKTRRTPINVCNLGTPTYTSPNISCIATPQIHRSNRLNSNKDYASLRRASKTACRSNQFPQSPAVTSRGSSASSENERSDADTKARLTEFSGGENDVSPFSVSEPREINMRSLRRPQKPLSRSCCQEGSAVGKMADHEDFRGSQTPQCTPRSSKLRLQRTSSMQPHPAGRTSLDGLESQQEYNQNGTTGTLGSRHKTSTARNNERSTKSSVVSSTRSPAVLGKSISGGSLVSKSDSSRRTSLDSQVSASPSASCNSSPLTPRASWSASDSFTNTMQGRSGVQTKYSATNSRLHTHAGSGLKTQPISAISPDRPGERAAKKANRPTNLSVFHSTNVPLKRFSPGEGIVNSDNQQFWDASSESQRLIRLSSLPAENRRYDADEDNVIRAKTVSPPSKVDRKVSLETSRIKTGNDEAGKQRCHSPSDSGNSSCTLGQKSGLTSPETPQVSTYNSPPSEPPESINNIPGLQTQTTVPQKLAGSATPPLLTVTCISEAGDGLPAELTDSTAVATSPSAASSLSVSGFSNKSNLMELSGILRNLPYNCEKRERQLSLPTSESLLAAASPIPRLQVPSSGCFGVGSPRCHRGSLNTSRMAEDPVYGCLNLYYASPPSPLSHIKLPYTTHTQRAQSVVVTPVCGIGLDKQATLVSTAHSTCGKPAYTGPGAYSHAPERHNSRTNLAAEGLVTSSVTKLQEELDAAKKHVAYLSCRLSANTSVVQAFEQSLHSMSTRMQQIMKVSSIKDKEVKELRNLVGQLRFQLSLAIGQTNESQRKNEKEVTDSSEVLRNHILGILKNGSQQEADSVNNFLRSSSYQEVSRIAADSPQQLNPLPMQESLEQLLLRNSGKLNRLKTSINRAFGRSKSRDPCDLIKGRQPITSSHHSDADGASSRHSPSSSSTESPSTTCPNVGFDGQSVSSDDLSNLQNQLADKDLRLTDAQLESLSRFHQLQQMQTLLTSLQNEISLLREENEQLHQTVDKCSQSGGSESLGASLFSTRLHSTELLKRLFVPKSIKGITIPVFLQLASSPGCNVNQNGEPSTQSAHLSAQQDPHAGPHLPSQTERASGISTKESRGSIQGLPHFPKLHLLGRITLGPKGSVKLLEDQVKALFQTYLQYLDPDDNLGLSADSIASLVIRCNQEEGLAQRGSGEQVIEQHVRIGDDQESDGASENCLAPDRVAGINVILHDNAYVASRRRTNSKDDGKRQCQPSFPVESTSAIAWISLLPCTLLQKMIESLLSNKFVIIYGPKGSGKLEFGRILMDAMARMFPGFWSGPPTVEYRQIGRSQNIQNELRQLLTDALAIEGLLILRLSVSNLVDLLEVMSEVPFQTHPRKVLLLVITDGLTFPKEPTELPNCPGIFPFLTDLQSTVAYMRRCIRQRFSQYAFHFLEVEQQTLQSLSQFSSTDFHQEFKCVAEILDWLPDFWLHLVRLKRNLAGSHNDAFPVSPFRLLACPFTIQASWTWFMELWDAEIQHFLSHTAESRASSLPPGNFTSPGASTSYGRNDSQRLGSFTRWMFSTWPWPELPSCINGIPLLQRSVFLPWDLTTTAPTAISGMASTGTEVSSSPARRLSQSGMVSQSMSVLTKLSLKGAMYNSDFFTSTQATGTANCAGTAFQCTASPRESCAAIYDSYSSIPALFAGQKEVVTQQLFPRSVPTSTPPLALLCAAKPSNAIACPPFV
ncbi:ATPases associated with a variety of cellular activities [Sparganum proliferum]